MGELWGVGGTKWEVKEGCGKWKGRMEVGEKLTNWGGFKWFRLGRMVLGLIFFGVLGTFDGGFRGSGEMSKGVRRRYVSGWKGVGDSLFLFIYVGFGWFVNLTGFGWLVVVLRVVW